jgi:predicted ATPase/transcriptional regulator with XRE-family HTH domain
MTTGEAKATNSSISEESCPHYFGEWLKRRRMKLGLTQLELAKRASCTIFTIRKIEAGERRPSKQLAELLSKQLEIPAEDQTTFIRVARGELNIERLFPPAQRSSRDSLPGDKIGPVVGNLPRPLTPFFGREPELAAVGQLLCDPRCSLITIVGQGGIGKTRLAIEAAHQSEEFFTDGVWFVSLVALNSPIQILPTIASALEFKFQDPTNPQAQLLRYLCSKQALLVLDNAEHVLDGAGLFAEILKSSPQVKLLITSRERVRLLNEWVFEIHGLPVPPNDQVEQFDAYSSVALFLQSARRVQAGFEIQEAEREWVLKICRTMEGMPLGIELSAAWVGLLSCEEIAREIEHNLDFLSVSMRDLPERHRSLRATLDHSWKLLTTEEKLILSHLSVFQGSFSREAAQAICGANLAVLSSLKNKILLYRNEQGYYGLHEIIRQYAELKLAEDPCEQERVKDQHATYYVHCLSEWEKALKSSQQLDTLNEMAQMINNLRQGWWWMLVNGQLIYLKSNQFNSRLFHSSLFSLSLFYEMHFRSWEAVNLFTEVIEYLKTAHAAFERSEDFYRLNSILGHITAYLGLHQLIVYQHAEARENLEEAICLLENNQSRLERAQAQSMLAYIYYQQGKMQRSAELLKQSLAGFQEERNTWWYLVSSINLALVYVFSGNLSESESLCQEGFRLVVPGDLRLEIPLRRVYAYLYYFQNDYVKAEELMQVNLQLAYQFKIHRGIIANCLTDISQVALITNRIEVAEKYIQECINLLSEYGKSYELAIAMLYLGKYLVARSEVEAGRDKFRQVIKMGQTFDAFYLVSWGMVNIARTYLIEGQSEKALEISLALRCCPIEIKIVQDEILHLLADLQVALPKEQVEAVMKQVDSRVSVDQARAFALAYALELVTE